MYERILVPTDGSSGSEAAAREAAELAERFDSTVHAINVVDTTAVPGMNDGGYVFGALEEAGEEATETVAGIAETAGVPVETAVLHGSPHRAILDYADEEGIDLVVMGTHGRRGLERYLLGSVTEKVVRSSERPVLTVQDTGSDADGGGEDE